MDKKVRDIFLLLKKNYPYAKISLNYSNELELLIAVILSAQCTDERVNKITKELFKKYKTAKDYAEADINELKQYIKSAGFYNSKAKYIKETCKIILEKHNGKVPNTMQELLKLPGVARKTANIVLSNGFNKNEGIAVDTHVRRLSYRLGLTKNKQPEKIEKDLMKIFPKNEWNTITYYLIEHGRKICKARKPKCKECFLNHICPKRII
ncbi:MAG: endonuclease III [Candidatus Woesearchaeota archaeon]